MQNFKANLLTLKEIEFKLEFCHKKYQKFFLPAHSFKDNFYKFHIQKSAYTLYYQHAYSIRIVYV